MKDVQTADPQPRPEASAILQELHDGSTVYAMGRAVAIGEAIRSAYHYRRGRRVPSGALAALHTATQSPACWNKEWTMDLEVYLPGLGSEGYGRFLRDQHLEIAGKLNELSILTQMRALSGQAQSLLAAGYYHQSTFNQLTMIWLSKNKTEKDRKEVDA